jgi:acyl-coenzyme A synthetase/AMP-(fatty) acid ligase
LPAPRSFHARSGSEPKAWSALADELASLPDLNAIAFVDMADYLDGEERGAARASIEGAAAGSHLGVVNLREAMREQSPDRLVPPRTIRADDISSYFCTGGTTGVPKIAVSSSLAGSLFRSKSGRLFATRPKPSTTCAVTPREERCSFLDPRRGR